MAIKTSICSICGAEVTKPQSYALPNGTRACRSHQEAQTAHSKAEEQKHKVMQKPQYHEHRGQYMPNFHTLHQGASQPTCKCFHCNKEGAMVSDLASIRLQAMAALRSRGSEEFSFDPEHISNRLFEACVFDIYGTTDLVGVRKYSTASLQEWQITQLIKPAYREVVQFGQIAVLCQSCAKEYGLDSQYPAPTVQQLSHMTLVGSLVMDSLMEEMSTK